ncbi:hypothetical protein IYR97_08160 [Pseudomonas fulva]|uniref:Uncharacterized protein n=1 Tax=Pseudomonas fulva TaxID=47880 RepID=A0A7S9Q9D3_9PSED|nr:hypothetical protein [Pseudomonas fulva]QPH45578.1 hypothetical protein IYR97_08160 [Pseudomonas fulva]QPH50663.1 hypothetical protein IZU98_08175 [Pseudomonas fulva]
MTVAISTYASGADWLTSLCTDLLPSNDWAVVRDTSSEKIFGLPGGAGFVAFVIGGGSVEIQAFPVFDPDQPVAAQAGGFTYAYSPFLPRFVLPIGEVKVWTLVNSRRLCGVIRSGSSYYSFYAGLILPFGSNKVYPFPCFIGGSGELGGSKQSAYPFMSGGNQYCPKVCLPGDDWQIVGGNSGGNSSFTNEFPYSYSYGFIHPFDGKFHRLRSKIDGGAVVYPALVVSSGRTSDTDLLNADDGMWLGYLDGVFAIPQGRAAESIIAVDGLDYLVVPNVSKSTETYGLRLS